jgi:hypothetical protein
MIPYAGRFQLGGCSRCRRERGEKAEMALPEAPETDAICSGGCLGWVESALAAFVTAQQNNGR